MIIPLPRFWIDWFSNASKYPERFSGCCFNRRIPLSHQSSNGCGRGIAYVNLVFVTHLPKSRCIWIIWHTLKHQCDGSVGQRTIYDIGVPCYPTHVRGAPIYIARVIIEDVFVCDRSINHVSTRGMQYPFGFSCRTRGIQNEQWILCIHLFAGAFILNVKLKFM